MVDRNFHISTPRLYLSYYDPSDDTHCDFFLTVANAPEVSHGNSGLAAPIPDREAARQSIVKKNEDQAETGYGRYLITLKPAATNQSDVDNRPFSEISESLERIGHVSLKLRKNPQAPRVPDIGFALLRRYWGKGYATEAVRAVIEHFETVWDVKDIAGFCNPLNEDSKRMFRRIGFEERGVRMVKGLKHDASPEAFSALVWTSKSMDKELEKYGL